MAARKRWRRYIPDDEISVRAFLHLIGRLFYYVGLHSEYFLLNFGRGASAVLALWHGVCWMLALGANILRPFFAAVWEDLRAPWRQMRSGLRNIRQVVREEREAGGSPAGKGLAYFFRGVLAYKHLLLRGLAYLLPAAAPGVLLVTVDGVLSSLLLRCGWNSAANSWASLPTKAFMMRRTRIFWTASRMWTRARTGKRARNIRSPLWIRRRCIPQGELTDRIIETSLSLNSAGDKASCRYEFIGV